jgi:hypothetical protein
MNTVARAEVRETRNGMLRHGKSREKLLNKECIDESVTVQQAIKNGMNMGETETKGETNV